MLLAALLLPLVAGNLAWGAEPPRTDVYRVGAGDALTVEVYGEPGLSGAFPVDAAGALDFPLLGPVAVQGRTATEVAAQLRSLLSPSYLVHPNVTVAVSSWQSQPVQVLGAVVRPGTYFLRGPTTVLQILSEGGGVSGEGVGEVRITRGAADEVVVLPYQQLLAQGGDDFALAAGDTVFVPQSMVSVLGQVGQPGEVPFRDGITISQCIASVGGAQPTADLARVYILRGDQRIRVNLRKVLNGRAIDATLQPGDRIYVRESAI
ncbi:MAG: polysaccharide biosynthesis/export family protein [Pseudomonadota bacterium]|nr:polysaccharide biosynthesis/export family protein [Pseudomonadota bacterium]